MRRFRLVLASVALVPLASVGSTLAAQSPATRVEQALANPARSDQQVDDARRKAAEVLTFSGVKSGDIVIDYLPGSGYWTRIFTSIVGPKGRVYALWPASGARFAAKALPALQDRHLPNVIAQVQPSDLPTAPQPVDLFWTVQNYHDLANSGGEPALHAFNSAVFAALKPGGTYVVIDHADAAGTGLAGTATRHRIDKDAVIRQIESVGFHLVAQSQALANPADDHQAKIFDPAIRGHTDQFVLKFQKPR